MNEHYQQGLELCQKEQYEKAILAFNRSLLLSPMHLESLYNRGLAKFFLEKYLDAIQDFNQALEVSPSHADIYSQRGVAYHLMKNNQEAIKDMDRALALEPANPYRYSSRAYIRGKMGDIMGAVDDYRRAVELDPEDAVAWNNLGILEMNMGLKQSAQEHFKKADGIADEGLTFERPNLDDLLKDANVGSSRPKITLSQPDQQEGKTEESLPPLPAIGNKNKPSAQSNVPFTDLTFNSYWLVLKQVFTSKTAFADFTQFIKAGFVMKKNKED